MSRFVSDPSQRCAPSRKYASGSCARLEVLCDFVHAHNLLYPSKHIKLNSKYLVANESIRSKYKQYIVNELKKHYTSDQTQWCKKTAVLSKMKQLNREELTLNTFRPDGPTKKNQWLNTLDIDKSMGQYEIKYPDFHFYGALPMDFNKFPKYGTKGDDFAERVISNNKYRIGAVINLDNHNQSGSHWVGLYADFNTSEVYYFDSYGSRPDKPVQEFMDRIVSFCSKFNNIPKNKVKSDYNRVRHQYENSECGIYAMNFILRLFRGDSF